MDRYLQTSTSYLSTREIAIPGRVIGCRNFSVGSFVVLFFVRLCWLGLDSPPHKLGRAL
jgi:hypothetical protein